MYLVVPPGGCFREVRRIELGPQALSIGRSEDCDVRVDVPGVDQEHARISEVALIAMGPDCAIGDVPLDVGSRRLIMPGDEIQIGSVVVALEGDDPSLVPPPPDGSPRPARVAHPKVRVVEGANFGDELVLEDEGREYVIGRHPSCGLVLEDREVSREHLRVKRRGFAIFIQDRSSTRGSWLGRSAVYQGATLEWSRPSMLRIGATVLSLEMPVEARRAVPAAQASAPMTPEPRKRPGTSGQYLASTPSASPISMRAPASYPSSIPAPPSSQSVDVEVAVGPSSGPDVQASHRDGHAANGHGNGHGNGGTGVNGHTAAAAELQSTKKIPAYHFDPTPPPQAVPMMHAAAMPGASAIPIPGPRRTAWKKSGPTLGKASGLLLLAVAGIAILGALFLVFSLLE